jgi:hypothetical protein
MAIRDHNGVMDFSIRTRSWYLVAFGTSHCGNTPGCTHSATACPWACWLTGPRIDANDTYRVTVNQNVDTHGVTHRPVYSLTRCDALADDIDLK